MSNEEKTALELEREKMEAAAKETNAKRTGVGTRVKVGSTRGRSVVNIQYEAFDENEPSTVPHSVAEFVKVSGITDDAKLAEMLVTGFNDMAYTEASDPIADYVNPLWKDEIKAQFRVVVRTMAKMLSGMKTLAEVATDVKTATDSKSDNFRAATA